MDLIKAFGAVNRTILRTTLYKVGLPVQTILQIRRGHRKTKLQAKYNRQYGENKQQRRSLPRISYKRTTLHNIPTRHDGRLHRNRLPRKIPYRVTNRRDGKSKLNTLLQKINNQDQTHTPNKTKKKKKTKTTNI